MCRLGGACMACLSFFFSVKPRFLCVWEKIVMQAETYHVSPQLLASSFWEVGGRIEQWQSCFRRHDFPVLSVSSLWRPSGSKCVVFYTAHTNAEWQTRQLLKRVHLSLRHRRCERSSIELCFSSRLSVDDNTRKASIPPPTGPGCLLPLLRFHSRWPCVKS